MKRRELGAALQEATGNIWENLDDTGKLPTRDALEELLGLALQAAAVLQQRSFAFRSAVTGLYTTSSDPATTVRERR